MTVSAPAGGSAAGAAVPRAPVVLVAEDDETIRELLVALLTGEGCRVVAAADGAGALRELVAMGARPPAVILLDIKMPRMGRSSPPRTGTWPARTRRSSP